MAVSKYIRIGLRADKSLNDLPDEQLGLANILDDLIPSQPFIPGDLTVINGLGQTDVWAQDLAEIHDSTNVYSPLTLGNDGQIVVGAPIDIQPRIRVIDKLVNDRIVVGDPPYVLGGSGPTATVFSGEALTSTAATLTGLIEPNDIYDASYPSNVITDEYWIDGLFGFSSRFHPSFNDSFGGITWEGHFSNPRSRPGIIRMNSFFLFEKDIGQNTGVYLPEKCVTQESFDATINAASVGSVHSISKSDGIHILDGMLIKGPDGLGSDPTHYVSSGQVSGNSFIFSAEPIQGTTALAATSSGDTMNFSFSLGEDALTYRTTFTDRMSRGETQKIRMTVWYPKPDQFIPAKSRAKFPPFGMRADMDTVIAESDRGLPFNHWYKQNRESIIGDNPPQNSYEHFERNVINRRNKRTGQYYLNQMPTYIRYTPEHEVDNISKKLNGGRVQPIQIFHSGANQFAYNGGYPESNVEKGDYILFCFNDSNDLNSDNKQYFLQVTDVSLTDGENDQLSITVDKFKLDETVSDVLTEYGIGTGIMFDAYLIKATGLVGIYQNMSATNTSTSNPITVNLRNIANVSDQFSTRAETDFFKDDIKLGDLVVTLDPDGSTNPQVFDRITTIDKNPSSHDVEITCTGLKTQTRVASQYAYTLIYAHRGLTDNSTISQCVGVIGREVASPPAGYPTANTAGQPYLALTTVEGISIGDYVQYFGGIQNDTEGAGADAGNGAQVVDIINAGTDNIIELKQTGTTNPPTPYNLDTTIPAARTVIFINSANDPGSGGVKTSSDKELCVMPLNTAPPFEGTDNGLETPPAFPALSVGGDFSITGIVFEDATSTEITTATDANGGLLIKTPNGGPKYWAVFS